MEFFYRSGLWTIVPNIGFQKYALKKKRVEEIESTEEPPKKQQKKQPQMKPKPKSTPKAKATPRSRPRSAAVNDEQVQAAKGDEMHEQIGREEDITENDHGKHVISIKNKKLYQSVLIISVFLQLCVLTWPPSLAYLTIWHLKSI